MADQKLTRIAIVSSDKCKPKKCRQECKKSCPVVKTGTFYDLFWGWFLYGLCCGYCGIWIESVFSGFVRFCFWIGDWWWIFIWRVIIHVALWLLIASWWCTFSCGLAKNFDKVSRWRCGLWSIPLGKHRSTLKFVDNFYHLFLKILFSPKSITISKEIYISL